MKDVKAVRVRTTSADTPERTRLQANPVLLPFQPLPVRLCFGHAQNAEIDLAESAARVQIEGLGILRIGTDRGPRTGTGGRKIKGGKPRIGSGRGVNAGVKGNGGGSGKFGLRGRER